MCFKPVHQWNGNDFGFKASKNRRVKSHSYIMRISHEKFMNHLTIPRRDTVLQDGSSGGRGEGEGIYSSYLSHLRENQRTNQSINVTSINVWESYRADVSYIFLHFLVCKNILMFT